MYSRQNNCPLSQRHLFSNGCSPLVFHQVCYKTSMCVHLFLALLFCFIGQYFCFSALHDLVSVRQCVLNSGRMSPIISLFFLKQERKQRRNTKYFSTSHGKKCIYLVPFLSVLLLCHLFVSHKLEDIPQSQVVGVFVHWVLLNASGCNRECVHSWKPIADFKLICSCENE